MISLVSLIYFLLILSVLLYLYSKWKYSYWRKIGLDYLEPEFFYGNIKSIVKKEISYGDHFDQIYKCFKSRGLKCGGYYNLFSPVFMPTSLELVKCVLHNDFAYFPNHGAYVNEQNDPLTGNLFFLENEKWKNLRHKLTPTFSSGKIKLIFPTILKCTDPMMKILSNHEASRESVQIKDLMLRFAQDVIASAAFGVEPHNLEDPDSYFTEYTKKFFHLNIFRLLNIGIGQLLPKNLLNKVGYRFIPKYIEDFFISLVKQTVEHREKNNISRKDFLQILMELKNNKEKLEDSSNPYTEFSINHIAANVFIFFVAGYETTANTISFALIELAENQKIQEKVRNEINTVLRKYDGEITYDAINDMIYLEQVLMETLRKHPPAQKLHRESVRTYKVPGTSITLEAGTKVLVPIFSIHRDPDYFPNPEKFDPERFSTENKAKIESGCFLGFGYGPRYCIGVRMGKLQTKMAIIRTIKEFEVTLSKKMKRPIGYEFSIIGAKINGGVWLDLKKIELKS